MKHLICTVLLIAALTAYGEDESDQGIQVLPANPSAGQAALQKQVRPLVVLPPESLQGHTLVVPLPGEQVPPVILKRNSIETVPMVQPALPVTKAPKGETVINRPLPAVVY